MQKKRRNDTILFALQAWMAGRVTRIRRRWKLEADRNLHMRRPTRFPHSTSISFPLLYASLLTRSVSHRLYTSFMCMYTGIIPLFNGSTYAQTRAQRIHTLMHTITHSSTSAHRRSSNRITLSLSRSTSLHPSLSI